LGRRKSFQFRDSVLFDDLVAPAGRTIRGVWYSFGGNASGVSAKAHPCGLHVLPKERVVLKTMVVCQRTAQNAKTDAAV